MAEQDDLFKGSFDLTKLTEKLVATLANAVEAEKNRARHTKDSTEALKDETVATIDNTKATDENVKVKQKKISKDSRVKELEKEVEYLKEMNKRTLELANKKQKYDEASLATLTKYQNASGNTFKIEKSYLDDKFTATKEIHRLNQETGQFEQSVLIQTQNIKKNKEADVKLHEKLNKELDKYGRKSEQISKAIAKVDINNMNAKYSNNPASFDNIKQQTVELEKQISLQKQQIEIARQAVGTDNYDVEAKKLQEINQELLKKYEALQQLLSMDSLISKQDTELNKMLEKAQQISVDVQATKDRLNNSSVTPQNKEEVQAAKDTIDLLEKELALYKEKINLAQKAQNTDGYVAAKKATIDQSKVVNDLNNKLKEQNLQVQNMDKFWGNLGYQWKKAFTSFTMYMSVTTIFYQLLRTTQKMVAEVKVLDKALTELKKVTDLSGTGLKTYTDKAYEMAESIAQVGSAMIEAATEFIKGGYGEQISLELGKVAL